MENQEANNQTGNEINNQSSEATQNQEVNQCGEENEQAENGNELKEKKEGSNFSMNLAIVGGVVGAGIGLLANPQTSKKIISNLSDSEFVKVAGKEFKKTAQELLAGQAQNSVKHLAEGYLSKIEDGLLSPKKDRGGDEKYQEIKEENKHLNERLQRIENMLNDLVESK